MPRERILRGIPGFDKGELAIAKKTALSNPGGVKANMEALQADPLPVIFEENNDSGDDDDDDEEGDEQDDDNKERSVGGT